MSTDVTTTREGRDLVIPTDADYAVMSYADLQQMQAFRVTGFSLVSKDELLGVPHIITRVTYWLPKKDQLGMVSLEATVADAETLERAIQRRWVPNVENLSQLRIEPNERVVYNDGGTGIRRQVTKFFHHYGAIDVGRADVAEDLRYDTPWTEWESYSETRRQSAEVPAVPSVTRLKTPDGERPMLLAVDRGLSVSKYSNEYADEAETYYLR